GMVTGNEVCDGDGMGSPGETATCDADCITAECGDGTPNTTAGEACDTAGDSMTCNTDCTAALCGDGYTNTAAGEACDALAMASANCDPDCSLPVCGDGVVNTAAGEACDDGNTMAGDGCDAVCQGECAMGEIPCGGVCVPVVTTFNPTGVIETYVVPSCATSIQIEAWGAQGGSVSGGRGARMRGDFTVTPGTTLNVVVGMQGTTNSCGGAPASGGGGGGSF